MITHANMLVTIRKNAAKVTISILLRTLIKKGLHRFYTKFYEDIFDLLQFARSFKIANLNDSIKFIQTTEDKFYQFHYLLQHVATQLYDKMIIDMNEELERASFNNSLVMILYFVVYISATGIMFILYVYPLADELKNKFIVTIKLLNIIPTSVISKINSISNYLKNN